MAVSALMEPLAARQLARPAGLPPLGDIGIRLYVGSDTDEAAAGLIEAAMRAQLATLG